MDLRLILAYADGDEDDLVVSMTEPELAEAKDLADLISQAVADEKESREKPKSGHTGGRGSKGMAGRGGKSTKVEV